MGLQAAEVGAMLLGSFVEAGVGLVKARTSQQDRAGHAQKSCWENGEFCVSIHSKSMRCPLKGQVMVCTSSEPEGIRVSLQLANSGSMRGLYSSLPSAVFSIYLHLN